MQSEIRNAYRRKAFELHPDRNKSPDAHYQFIRIRQAYEVLSDPKKRAQYDTRLSGLETKPAFETTERTFRQATPEPRYYDPIEANIKIYLLSWKDVFSIPPSVLIRKLIITPMMALLYLIFGSLIGLIPQSIFSPAVMDTDDRALYLHWSKILVPFFALLFLAFGKKLFRSWYASND